ncbi:unnamed protein product [Rotaria magnacalcarata]|uniref:3CxxC-type domain-containing protein n=3 Tax=Rotaria magnacalcarata TaxID=392030 RepID=A0A815EUR3_9BILA|nr:unnamed protein product [Rotaria magnacalcarata]CAF1542817.1 unnamed protein product [Rotaria magnacalcarata]CAF2086232.1 unnamed protein product [Rotaria magnacalcarata]CAF2097602.1 unnamed protein product [Rotaria magnacalcarata]CAF2113413.1 unnamed protein product [Rotaria magnacalcarata]
MTGPVHQYGRQYSLTADCSTMHKSYQSQLRRCSSVNDQDSFKLKSAHDQHTNNLIFQRKVSVHEDDSGTEENERHRDHTFTEKLDHNENKPVIKSFGPISDEDFSECEIKDELTFSSYVHDLELTKNVMDNMKKYFCFDTSTVFHAEFARLISIPLLLRHNVRYYLFAEAELDHWTFMNFNLLYRQLDNAKAQFSCPNTYCQHVWTSMRARISFSVYLPKVRFIVLKIFGQNCRHCGTYTNALWYIDEVCRIIKNLALSFFETYHPDMMANVELEKNEEVIHNKQNHTHKLHYNHTQRQGRMLARHAKEYCEACRIGLCFT